MGVFKKLQEKREKGQYISTEEQDFIIKNDSSEVIRKLFIQKRQKEKSNF